jgi:hypothetical protein
MKPVIINYIYYFIFTYTTYKILEDKPEGKRPPRIARYIWKDNIKMDLKETGCESVNWIHLAWDRDQRGPLVNKIGN